ncbi:hypothetical protein E4U43_006939 [Claviceps pusilla]|uniref:Uncharacterized protein n=1 Tax=Claviceps pusilla TaxID=123648 RepID=A0A9P7N1D5_9HYPO|nr:hypothetical protein E4U43_006939 [Claviceps pusilla]
MSLLAEQALAACQEGLLNHNLDRWINGGPCVHERDSNQHPPPNGVFACGDQTTFVVFSGKHFTLYAPYVDSSIRINCGPFKSFFYSCTSGGYARPFDNPCGEGITTEITVDSVIER